MKDPQKWAQRRQRLLEAAVVVFADKGYHAATVDDVIRQASISRATFYSYFRSKEDLFTVIVDLLLEAQSAFVLSLQERILSRSADYADLLTDIVRTMEQEARGRKHQMKVFFQVIQGSSTRAERHFHKMQKVTLDHFTNSLQAQMESLGYTEAAARSLARVLIGGLMNIGNAILLGEMSRREIDGFVQGIAELLGQSPPAAGELRPGRAGAGR